MNKQEIFDKALARLRNGKGRCSIGGSCAYTGNDNNCVVGALLSQATLEAIEQADRNTGAGVRVLLSDCEVGPLVAEDLSLTGVDNFDDRNTDVELLVGLQIVHDDIFSWSENQFNNYGEAHMKRLANCYNLTYTKGNSHVQA